MECREVRPALSDLVDGVIARDVRPEVEAHLQGCSGCRALLADLRRMREAARALPKMAAPESLWPKVRADFVAAASGREPARAFAPVAAPEASGPRRPATRLWFAPPGRGVALGLAAAAVVVLAVSSGLYLVSRRAPAPPAATTAAVPPPATPAQAAQSVEAELTQADEHYEKAIAALQQAASAGQAVLDPQTQAVLQKNMGVVDQAISESRAAVRSEPTSEVAQSSLFDALQRKVGLLRDTIALINAMRQGDSAGTAKVAGSMGKS
jgi:anti-sigma factor RsiW